MTTAAGQTSRAVCLTILGCALLAVDAVYTQAQQTPAPQGINYVPGKPWTRVIPDPDLYKWRKVQTRPGYRFRGMQPMHQRFYDYIQAKRKAGQALSFADESMIRWLQSLRRWPEAPAPNELGKAFMRYLRNLDRQELNFAESLMYSQLVSRGYLPSDPVPNEMQRKLIDYLNSGPFQPRNWFERTFGRVEPWIEQYAVSQGYDVGSVGGSGGPSFPPEPFNGMHIFYNISGAIVGPPVDVHSFGTTRTFKGVLPPGQLTVSGTARMSGGFGADVTVKVWAGAKEEKLTTYIKRRYPGFNSQPFSFTVPVPKGTDSGGFLIQMDGHYSMGGGWRGLTVRGFFERDSAEKRAEAEAAWRKLVEDTLTKLGYEDTPEGKALKEMRDALAGGDAAWKAYVDRQLAALGYENTPQGKQCEQLATALEAGGEVWDKYVDEQLASGTDNQQQPPGGQQAAGGQQDTGGQQQTNQGGRTGQTTAPTLPDVGGLHVGTSTADGEVQDAADHFDKTGQVATSLQFEDLPDGTTILAVWMRNGKEIARSQRQTGGSGWVSFNLHTQDPGGLAKGTYVVTITAGEKVLGRKTFTIGN